MNSILNAKKNFDRAYISIISMNASPKNELKNVCKLRVHFRDFVVFGSSVFCFFMLYFLLLPIFMSRLPLLLLRYIFDLTDKKNDYPFLDNICQTIKLFIRQKRGRSDRNFHRKKREQGCFELIKPDPFR